MKPFFEDAIASYDSHMHEGSTLNNETKEQQDELS